METLIRPKTQSEKILAKLKEAGAQGVTSRQLNEIAFRYSARILELRRDGYDISAIQIKRGYWRFILLEAA